MQVFTRDGTIELEASVSSLTLVLFVYDYGVL